MVLFNFEFKISKMVFQTFEFVRGPSYLFPGNVLISLDFCSCRVGDDLSTISY